MGFAAAGLERRAKTEGLIGPQDNFLAVQPGDLDQWVSSGADSIHQRMNAAVGYTDRRLVVIGTNHLAAVDLIMVWDIDVIPTLGIVKVTFLHDHDPYRTTFRWTMTRRRDAETFAAGLRAAATRRAADFPPNLADEVRHWGDELDRRISEHIRVRESLPAQVDVVAHIPTTLRVLALERGNAAPSTHEHAAWRGRLALLPDRTLVLTATSARLPASHRQK